jgi:hypothetical protein
MVSAASQVVRETSVASTMSAPHATASATWLRSRSRVAPRKSTSSSIANEPNAANVATVGFAITWTPTANSAGMISAVRTARRSAAKSGSRLPSHATTPTCPP